jgi:glutathione S-transferase
VILYDHPASGNCLKPRILLRQLGLPFELVTVDLFTGETRTDEHLARNPDGRVPVLELDSGEQIAESGAILLHLGQGTPFLPAAGPARTRVHQWMFFEQNRIEPELGVARFLWLSGLHAQAPEVFQNRLDRGRDALVALERGLATGGSPFVAGADYTVADVALYAYVHCGAESGADPREHPNVAAWLDRVEATAGFENDLAPFPEHAAGRPT